PADRPGSGARIFPSKAHLRARQGASPGAGDLAVRAARAPAWADDRRLPGAARAAVPRALHARPVEPRLLPTADGARAGRVGGTNHRRAGDGAGSNRGLLAGVPRDLRTR